MGFVCFFYTLIVSDWGMKFNRLANFLAILTQKGVSEMREAFEIEVTTKLIKLKKSKGWLAEQVGISPAYLSDILHGNRIAEDRVRQIRKVLKLEGD